MYIESRQSGTVISFRHIADEKKVLGILSNDGGRNYFFAIGNHHGIHEGMFVEFVSGINGQVSEIIIDNVSHDASFVSSMTKHTYENLYGKINEETDSLKLYEFGRNYLTEHQKRSRRRLNGKFYNFVLRLLFGSYGNRLNQVDKSETFVFFSILAGAFLIFAINIYAALILVVFRLLIFLSDSLGFPKGSKIKN